MKPGWVLQLDKQVLKDLDTIHPADLPAIRKWFYRLQENPFPNEVKKLKGKKELILRLRVGKYRIIYSVDSPTNLVIILAVSHRKDAYR